MQRKPATKFAEAEIARLLKQVAERDATIARMQAAMLARLSYYGVENGSGSTAFAEGNGVVDVRSEIKLLNEYGAWLPHTYYCEYTLASYSTVIRGFKPGGLGR